MTYTMCIVYVCYSCTNVWKSHRRLSDVMLPITLSMYQMSVTDIERFEITMIYGSYRSLGEERDPITSKRPQRGYATRHATARAKHGDLHAIGRLCCPATRLPEITAAGPRTAPQHRRHPRPSRTRNDDDGVIDRFSCGGHEGESTCAL